MGKLVAVAKISEVQPGKGLPVMAENEEIALFNIGGKFCAINNVCLHQGGPLGEGEVNDHFVTCPYHGWEYDILTGEVTFNPNSKVKTYPVKVEGDDVKVEI